MLRTRMLVRNAKDKASLVDNLLVLLILLVRLSLIRSQRGPTFLGLSAALWHLPSGWAPASKQGQLMLQLRFPSSSSFFISVSSFSPLNYHGSWSDP